MTSTSSVLVVADGEVDVALLEAGVAAQPRPLLIAADGGAGQALAAGVTPDVVVGDFDSLDPADRARLEELGVELRVADRDKDESDMELCLLAALGAGASRITIIGALGLERPEHSIANLLLLADPRFDEVSLEIAAHGSRIWRIGRADGPGQAAILGIPGDYISLFPMGAAVHGVSSVGLRFRLHDETLPLGPSRGLSNELLEARARVTTRRGRLLLVHTTATGS